MANAQTTVTLLNKVGLHARPASKFVQMAARFTSTIMVRHRERTGNAKRMLDILKLSAGGGAEITISAEGEDAEAALAALTALIAEKFGEAE
jgi:phosphotransferase system HPr (HPr) family protein